MKVRILAGLQLFDAGFRLFVTPTLAAVCCQKISLQEKLAMADAIIVAVSRAQNCNIITSNSDLKDQPKVTYLPKKGR